MKKYIDKAIEKAIDKHSLVIRKSFLFSTWRTYEDHAHIAETIDRIWEAIGRIENYLGVELKHYPAENKLVKKKEEK